MENWPWCKLWFPPPAGRPPRLVGKNYYCIFDLKIPLLEVYKLDDSGQYKLETPREKGLFWIAGLESFPRYLGRRSRKSPLSLVAVVDGGGGFSPLGFRISPKGKTKG